MEHQTGFELNAALENWRQELGLQPYLTPDYKRELETHLRDLLAELQARGLNDEESFFLARRRIGAPQKLGEEFVKADPTAAWRERVFWFVFGLLVLQFWEALVMNSALPLLMRAGPMTNALPDWVMYYVPQWLKEFGMNTRLNAFYILSAVLWLAVVVFFASGRMQRIRRAFEFVIQSRARFIATMFSCVALIFAVHILAVRFIAGSNQYGIPFLQNNFWLLWLIAMGVWLLPAKSRERSSLA